MAQQYFNLGGVNTYINPLLNDGALIHSVNMESSPFGAKTKRNGYTSFLGTPDTAQINSLFSFNKNDGTTQYLYRKSGTLIYSSYQGTGAWTLTGNGTVDASSYVGNAVLNNTLIIGDGVGSTRYTTSGTAFVNGTLAPVAPFLEEYQGRIYAAGTSSTLFYSTSNDATNWNTSGTSDSSSLQIPGAGKLARIFKAQDKLIATKNSGIMNKWDGYARIDMSTNYGPSSPYSVARTEDYWFFANQYGIFGQGGGKPQLISNPIQRQIYNAAGVGIAGSVFPTLQAECHKYDYLLAVGSVTDDFVGRTISNAIIKYDYQKNEFLNYSFAHNPTALHSYTDVNNERQLIFGDASGQCYKISGTATTDNGSAIASEMIFVYHYGAIEYEKKWNFYRGIFNPGCQARVQIACVNTYQDVDTLPWRDLGDCTRGVCEYRFPQGSKSNLLYVRITESSKNAKYTYYGCALDAAIDVKS